MSTTRPDFRRFSLDLNYLTSALDSNPIRLNLGYGEYEATSILSTLILNLQLLNPDIKQKDHALHFLAGQVTIDKDTKEKTPITMVDEQSTVKEIILTKPFLNHWKELIILADMHGLNELRDLTIATLNNLTDKQRKEFWGNNAENTPPAKIDLAMIPTFISDVRTGISNLGDQTVELNDSLSAIARKGFTEEMMKTVIETERQKANQSMANAIEKALLEAKRTPVAPKKTTQDALPKSEHSPTSPRRR